MSENMKSRQNRVRRNVTALVSAVALACGTTAVVAPSAGAYLEDSSLTQRHGDERGKGPSVSTSLNSEKTEIRAGESFNATVRVEATAPIPNASDYRYGKSDVNAVVFDLQLDPRLSVQLIDGSSEFRWDDGITRQPSRVGVDEASNTIEFEFVGTEELPLGAKPAFTLNLPLTANEKIDDGQELGVTVATEAFIRPNLDWTYGDWSFQDTMDPCVRRANGVLTFSNSGEYGTWLGDLWLGTNSQYFRLEGDPVIKVSGPQGESIAAFPGPGYPESTMNPAVAPTINTGSDGISFENYRWLRRYQWRFNDEASAGDIWIPEGSKVEVSQSVRSTTCVFMPRLEQFGVKIESYNAPLSAVASASEKIVVRAPSTSASVGDRVWIDINGNGIQDAGETDGVGGVGVTVSATSIPDGLTLTEDEKTLSTTTGADGKWLIENLYPGVEYEVSFDESTLPEGYKVTTSNQRADGGTESNDSNENPSKVTLNAGEQNLTYDLGIVPQRASIGDRVWIDINGNGIQDAGETDGVGGVGVTVSATSIPDGLTLTEDEKTLSTTTGADGKWLIENLYPGVEYEVSFDESTLPEGYRVTTSNQRADGGTESNDSNENPSKVTLNAGEQNLTYDLGLVEEPETPTTPTATIGDRVWIDQNGNGIQDDGEKGVPNVKVSVKGQGRGAGPAVEAVTDKNGNWKVEGLTPGKQYNVRFELPNGYYETVSTAGEDLEKDSNGLAFSTKTLAEGSGGFNLSYDLGLVQPATIGDFVWDDGEYTVTGDGSKVGVKDTDYNGVQDSEKGIANVRVTLTDASGNSVKDINGKTVAPATTDADGKYLFGNLRPGTYTVNFSYPQGYEETKTKQGQSDKDSNGLTTTATIESGQSDLTIDLGLVRRNATQTTTTVTNPPTTTPTTTVTKEPTTTPTTTVTKEPTTTPTTTVTKDPTTTPTTTVTKEPTTTPTTTVTTKVTTEKQVPTTVTTQVPTTVTTAGNCKTCTPTTVTSNVPTTIATTVPTTLTSTTVVPTTVVKTTTNKVVVTDENSAIIGDKVYIDENSDGKQDPNENEGVPNVTVIVTGKDGEEQRTVTDKDGNWQLVVQPGDYTVKFETDRVPSVPEQVERNIVVKPGEKKDDIDLGVLRPGTVGDRVWEDTNGDGKQDEGEKGVPNVIVKVARDGEPTRTTYTDENGKWTVEGLTPNTEYRVEFVTPEGWTRTNTPAETVTLKPGATNLDYDLGIKRVPTDKPVQPGQFGGSIVINNPDGSREGVENVIVRATPPAGVDEPVRTSTSDKGGSWTITDLTPDTEYTVTYIIPRGYQVINLPKGATLDKDGNVTVTAKVNRELPTNLGFDLEVERGSSIPGTPATVTVTETPITQTTQAQVQSSNDFLSKCWANATQSPFLYLAPIALIGAVGGELARPYMGAINEQLNQLNAQLQGAFRRDTPEWGDGGRGADREDPFAEFRAQIDAANRQLQQLASDPNVQRLGGIAAGVLALIAAGTVIYDWCSNEPGEAKTASSRRGGTATATSATTAPTTSTTTSTTSTEPTPKP